MKLFKSNEYQSLMFDGSLWVLRKYSNRNVVETVLLKNLNYLDVRNGIKYHCIEDGSKVKYAEC